MNNYRTEYQFSLHNSLLPQFSALCTLQKNGDLYGHPLPYTVLVDDIMWLHFNFSLLVQPNC